MQEKPNVLGVITKIIFIGGAVLLFVLLTIWVIRFVPRLLSGAGNVSDSITGTLRGGDVINVTLNNSEVESESPFIISWDYSPNVPGEYFFTYSCEDSLMMDIQSSNGPKRILCNSEFRLGENINTISMVPTVTKKNIFVDSEIKISYKDAEKKEVAFGKTTATLKNTDGASTSANPFDANLSASTVTSTKAEETPPLVGTTSSAPKTTPKIGGNTISPTYYGKPDLVITNIAKTVNQSALSFTVYNYGTNSSGNWFFSYTDAEDPSRVLYSPTQPSLLPNQGLFTQIRFDGQRNDSQLVNVYLDPVNSIIESNEYNNQGSVVITGNTYNSNYNNNNYNYNSNDDADLVIENLEVGRMSGSRFIEDDTLDDGDDSAVRFVVVNQGGKSTGNWRYEITNTPYDNNNDYRSNNQSSLRPGERQTIIIEFNNIDEGNHNIKVEVDSDDDVNEENERNNDDTVRLRVQN